MYLPTDMVFLQATAEANNLAAQAAAIDRYNKMMEEVNDKSSNFQVFQLFGFLRKAGKSGNETTNICPI